MDESKFLNVKCLICDSSGFWKSVDQYRYKPHGMYMCEKCGFVTYPKVIEQKAALKEYYEEEYRDAPSFNNIVTGQKKLHYHGEFLKSTFKKWKESGKEAPVVVEIGSAFGMFLDWMRSFFPKGDFNGTELTKSFVRVAYHRYGLKLTPEIDTSKRYDLIASYKVAEHMPEFDKELDKYFGCLKDDGVLYISVPQWFGPMVNFGLGGFNVEYYYHKNHINYWTRNHFEGLLARHGFEIVEANHVFYDSTYLCKKNASLIGCAPKTENPSEVEGKMKQIFEAAKAFDQGDYEAALRHYQDFPDAHIGFYEKNRKQIHQHGFEWAYANVLQKAIAASPESAPVRVFAADICMRYSKWELALQHFDEALQMRPNDAAILMNLSHCYRQMSKAAETPEDKLKFLNQARQACLFVSQIAPNYLQEAITWMMHDDANIPTPAENPVK